MHLRMIISAKNKHVEEKDKDNNTPAMQHNGTLSAAGHHDGVAPDRPPVIQHQARISLGILERNVLISFSCSAD